MFHALFEHLYHLLVVALFIILSLTLIKFGASRSYRLHQGIRDLRPGTHQRRAWKTPLEVGLAAWISNEDISALRVEVELLQGKVCNLRRERKYFRVCVRGLRRGKEVLRGAVRTLRREKGGLRGEVCNLRREKKRLGEEVRCLTRMKDNIGALALNDKAEPRPYSPASSITSGELDPKAIPQARDQGNVNDAQIQALKRDKRYLESLNRELADKYSESLRRIENAQANSCSSCLIRNSTASLIASFVDRSERGEPPGRRVTQSCCVPESLPPNPDRNRRQITKSVPVGDGGDGVHTNVTFFWSV